MRTIALSVTLVALVTGCASNESASGRASTEPYVTDTAVYHHPQTGDVRHCDNRIQGFFWWSGAMAFGECKSKLEEQGYIREGKKSS